MKLEYSDAHIFENGYLIIRYRFRNALYYQFDTIKTTDNQIKIFDTSNFKNEFDFVVHGLYGKHTYTIKTTPEKKIHSNSFKTVFNNLKREFYFQEIPKIAANKLELQRTIPSIQSNKITFKLNQPKIKEQVVFIQNNPFNESEFI